MSTPEHETPAESRSSVSVTLNAKREVQATVKVYAGDSADDVAAARELAVENFYEVLRATGSSHAA